MNSSQQLPDVVNPNARTTLNLFDGNNYKEWSYSDRVVIGGAKWLGCADGKIKEPSKKDPKYSNWEYENTLIMNWIVFNRRRYCCVPPIL